MKGRKRSERDAWKGKLDPLLFELVSLYKETSRAADALRTAKSPELASETRARIAEQLQRLAPEITRKCVDCDSFPDASIFLGCDDPTGSEGIFAWYCYQRTREPFWKLVVEEAKGSLEAQKRIVQLREEWNALCNEGKVKPFKINLDHWQLLEIGLPLGLDTLSADELAEFYDCFCPCGKDGGKAWHDADTLKKLRAKVKREKSRLKEMTKNHADTVRRLQAITRLDPSEFPTCQIGK